MMETMKTLQYTSNTAYNFTLSWRQQQQDIHNVSNAAYTYTVS